VTSLELPVDAPDERSCGECRLCIDACPTDALTDPYHLDARRCIAYLTIEHEGPIAPELRGQMGEWIFGCDICQDVYPHNTRVPATTVAEFSAPGFKNGFPALVEILSIRSDEDFKSQFAGTPLMRAGRQGLIRSASLAAAHLNRTDLIPLLEKLCSDDHEHSLVREDAAWAMQQLQEIIV
jgi:epoxyqueuosine reductase